MKNRSLLFTSLFIIFTNSLFAHLNNTWTNSTGGFWNVGTNWDMGLPNDQDFIIRTAGVTVTYSTTENSVKSVYIGNGADLIVNSLKTLTTTKNGPSGGDYKSFHFTAKSNKMELPLGDLNSGGYFITIYNNTTIQTQKIIKL